LLGVGLQAEVLIPYFLHFVGADAGRDRSAGCVVPY
jgi:hypothetical protein